MLEAMGMYVFISHSATPTTINVMTILINGILGILLTGSDCNSLANIAHAAK